MPVLVSCSCGKQLRVPDEVVGKSVRCPVCKAVVLATPSAPATIASASASESDTDAAMVRFTCGACGKEMQALAEYGGQETGCPDCNASVMIPVRGGVPGPARQPPAAVHALPPDLPEPTDAGMPSARRLRAARPKRRRWPWVGGAAALLLLGLGLVPWLFGYGVFFYFFRSTAAPDLALIPPDAQGFVTIRAADVWKTDALLHVRNVHSEFREAIKKRETDLGLAVTDCERVTLVFKDVDGAFRPGGDERDAAWWIVCLTARPYDKKKLLDGLAPGSVELSYQNRRYHVSDGPASKGAVYFHSDRVFVVGPKGGVHACLDHLASPKTDGPLKAAIKEAAGTHQLVIGIAPKPKDAENLRKGLPAAMQPLASLFDAQYLLVTGDVKTSLELEITFVFADAARAGEATQAADALRTVVAGRLDQARKARPKDKELFDQLESTVSGMKVGQKKELVIVQIKSDVALAGLVPELARVRSVSLATGTGENLQRLARAMQAYRADPKNNNHFPAADRGGLSWRVHLLPYLGEEELYRKFRLNEPYNSPWNAPLKEQMPSVFRTPEAPEGLAPFMTSYQVFVGPNAPFSGNRQLAAQDIADGQSNTIAIADAAALVEWTRPGDIPFDPANFTTTAMLGRPSLPRFTVVMFDGSLYTYSRSMDLNKLKALITYNGGEPVVP